MVSASIAESVCDVGGTVVASADAGENSADLSVCDDTFDDAMTTTDEEVEEADDEEAEETEEDDDEEGEDDDAASYSDGAFDDADSADEEPTKASPVAAHPLHSDKTIKLLKKLGEDLGESDGKLTEVFSNIGKLFSSLNSEPTG